jgi:HPt (histidine-containing phosphotransfer) domain-containing protein
MSLKDIAESLGLDLAAVERLASTFLAASEQDLEELEAAVNAGDPQAVARLAHHIKGAAAALEMEPIRAEAEALERKGRAATLKGANDQLSRLRAHLSAFGSSLNNR